MSSPIGSVAACWRYPVKSLQGFPAARVSIEAPGVRGDREHAVIDTETGHLLSAKRLAALLQGSATDERVTFPDGQVLLLDDPAVDEVLGSWLGRPVHLASLDEAGERSYEMTFDPPDDTAEYYEIPAPPGSFLDLAPVHVVTLATLAGCAAARPDLDWDVRRFRPNLVLDVDLPPFAEQEWVGRRLAVGGVTLSVDSPTVRCAMPLRAQPGGIEREPGLFKAMGELNESFPNHLGLYCSVAEPGDVATGDPVALT
ncbi:MOSC domain-containing protein [Aquihabitans sp. McL0605]|uniref:MOSC domain-containing protein n=1 Tax=Aquihabitans sp. McL0605 TaxID=3415671 RepID=UPI003CEAEA30